MASFIASVQKSMYDEDEFPLAMNCDGLAGQCSSWWPVGSRHCIAWEAFLIGIYMVGLG